MAGLKAKGGKKNRKLGRNQAFCKAYRAADRETINKRRKLRRHLRKFRNDGQAMIAFRKVNGTDDYLNSLQRHEVRS